MKLGHTRRLPTAIQFRPNWKRGIPPLGTVHVPRVVFPKKLPCHYEFDVDGRLKQVPFCIAVHFSKSKRKFIYVKRV